MKISIEKTELEDVCFVHTESYRDGRGFFVEAFRHDVWDQAGLHVGPGLVQWNHSGSAKNVLRGLHFQWDPPMGKLMRVIRGSAFLVAVDIRKGSPTFGRWVGRELQAEDPVLFWAPPGCARGFAVTSEFAELMYMCTGTYSHEGESGIRWNDPGLGIAWPVVDPIVSEKDAKAQTLGEWALRPESEFFRYEAR